MEPRVVIEHRVLDGHDDSSLLQRFATVYLGRTEYRVYAPAKATGDVLAWIENCFVRTSNGYAEFDSPTDRSWILQAVQQELERGTEEVSAQESVIIAEADKRKVFVVHGRNLKARDAVFAFLRASDLAPIEWEEVVASTGKPFPFIGEALDAGFSVAQAAVVLLTGDDMARAGKRYLKPDDVNEERVLTPQPRPNVLYEAGMAQGRHPDRTVFVSLGSYRKFSYRRAPFSTTVQ
jgi:hypothetical protein